MSSSEARVAGIERRVTHCREQRGRTGERLKLTRHFDRDDGYGKSSTDYDRVRNDEVNWSSLCNASIDKCHAMLHLCTCHRYKQIPVGHSGVFSAK